MSPRLMVSILRPLISVDHLICKLLFFVAVQVCQFMYQPRSVRSCYLFANGSFYCFASVAIPSFLNKPLELSEYVFVDGYRDFSRRHIQLLV